MNWNFISLSPILFRDQSSYFIKSNWETRLNWFHYQLGMTPINAFDAFNLKPGGEYKFQVTPRNRYGWGESVTMTNSVKVSEIVDLPEFTKILPGQLKVLEGATVKLECEASALLLVNSSFPAFIPGYLLLNSIHVLDACLRSNRNLEKGFRAHSSTLEAELINSVFINFQFQYMSTLLMTSFIMLMSSFITKKSRPKVNLKEIAFICNIIFFSSF